MLNQQSSPLPNQPIQISICLIHSTDHWSIDPPTKWSVILQGKGHLNHSIANYHQLHNRIRETERNITYDVQLGVNLTPSGAVDRPYCPLCKNTIQWSDGAMNWPLNEYNEGSCYNWKLSSGIEKGIWFCQWKQIDRHSVNYLISK